MQTSMKTQIGDVFEETKNIQNKVDLNKVWLSQDMTSLYWSDLSNKIQNFQKMSEHFIHDFVLCPSAVQSKIRLYVVGTTEYTTTTRFKNCIIQYSLLMKRVQFQIASPILASRAFA